jgi:hypothetical protein
MLLHIWPSSNKADWPDKLPPTTSAGLVLACPRSALASNPANLDVEQHRRSDPLEYPSPRFLNVSKHISPFYILIHRHGPWFLLSWRQRSGQIRYIAGSQCPL